MTSSLINRQIVISYPNLLPSVYPLGLLLVLRRHATPCCCCVGMLLPVVVAEGAVIAYVSES